MEPKINNIEELFIETYKKYKLDTDILNKTDITFIVKTYLSEIFIQKEKNTTDYNSIDEYIKEINTRIEYYIKCENELPEKGILNKKEKFKKDFAVKYSKILLNNIDVKTRLYDNKDAIVKKMKKQSNNYQVIISIANQIWGFDDIKYIKDFKLNIQE